MRTPSVSFVLVSRDAVGLHIRARASVHWALYHPTSVLETGHCLGWIHWLGMVCDKSMPLVCNVFQVVVLQDSRFEAIRVVWLVLEHAMPCVG